MSFSFTHNTDTYNNIKAYSQTIIPSSPSTDSGYPTIQIVSPHDGQLVPSGEVTIQGISSDNEETDCQVYADVNDITPMRRVIAAGDSGEALDFSKWIFTYTQDYQLIKEGDNELTAKITCVGDETLDLNPFPAGTAAPNSPLSEWHTINVTGSVGAPSVPLPLPTVGNIEGLTEEEEEEVEEEVDEEDDDSDGESNGKDNEEPEEGDESDNISINSDEDDSSDEGEDEDADGDESENDEAD